MARRQLADPHGVFTLARMEARQRKRHYFHGICPLMMAPDALLTGFRERVTCRVCLYHMGLYVPLTKLSKHQTAVRQACTRELNRRAQNFNASGNPEYTQ